ncbi:hypothetical protein J4450_04260 [Candidatus Micrarchaeota archaeon]|nr:hypothetical protein [Candidatus Micrarchaeota archaeon]
MRNIRFSSASVRSVATVIGIAGLALSLTMFRAAHSKPAPESIAKPSSLSQPVTFGMERDLLCKLGDGSIALRRGPPSETFSIKDGAKSRWVIKKGQHYLEGETTVSIISVDNGGAIAVFYGQGDGQPIAVRVPRCPIY